MKVLQDGHVEQCCELGKRIKSANISANLKVDEVWQGDRLKVGGIFQRFSEENVLVVSKLKEFKARMVGKKA